jgi:hypothetical protein
MPPSSLSAYLCPVAFYKNYRIRALSVGQSSLSIERQKSQLSLINSSNIFIQNEVLHRPRYSRTLG